MRKICTYTLAPFLLLFLCGTALAQQSGINTNVLPTHLDENGVPVPDPNLGDYPRQRQVEPAVAASSWDPDTILAAFIDFRSVDHPGTPTSGTFGEAWMAITKSYDRGRTWSVAWVPGYPDDTTDAGLASPLLGLQAAGDPVLTPNVNGYFHLGGLFFERGGIANIGVATYKDFHDSESGDNIRYLGARIIDRGSASDIGNFNDKPAIAADVPRTPGQTACGNVYIAYTTFHGNKRSGFTTKIGFSRSTDCGENWSNPIYLNKSYNQNQGVAMAIDPRNGDIYVVWRHVQDGNKLEHAILMVKSTDGGQTFTSPEPVIVSTPFDQIPPIRSVDENGNRYSPAFRMNAFPALAVDRDGNVFVAIQERGVPGAEDSPRITIRTLPGANPSAGWSAPSPVDLAEEDPNAHQVMPVMSYSGGILRVMWYDFRDSTNELNGCANCSESKPLTSGDLPEGQPGPWISGFDRKMNVRVAQWSSDRGLVDGNPVFEDSSGRSSIQVSLYQEDPLTGKVLSVPNSPNHPAVNRPNLPMYAGGTMPFAGDYMGLMSARQFTKTDENCDASENAPWRWATKNCDYAARSSYAVWYDTRDVAFPTQKIEDGALVPVDDPLTDVAGWQLYSSPGYIPGVSGTLPAACLNYGSRDGNTYFAEINSGIVVGSPAPSRQLGSNPVALPFYIENPNPSTSLMCSDPTYAGTPMCDPEINPDGSRFFRVTLSADEDLVDVSLEPSASITKGYVEILPFSAVSANAYVECASCSGNEKYPVTVLVEEINLNMCTSDDPETCSLLPIAEGGLVGSFTFNEDPNSPDVSNADSQENYGVVVSDPEVSTTVQWRNAQWRNAQWRNAQWRNAQWRNVQWRNAQWRNLPSGDPAEPIAEVTWTVTNSSDVATAINSVMTITDPDDDQGYLLLITREYALPDECNTAAAVQQILSVVPDPQLVNSDYDDPQTAQWRNAQWRNAQWRNAQWRNAQWRNAQWRNSSYATAPVSDSVISGFSAGSLGGSKMTARMMTADVSATWGLPLDDTRATRPDDKINITLVIFGDPDSNLANCSDDSCREIQDLLGMVSHVAVPQAGDVPLSDKLFSKTFMLSTSETSTTIGFGEKLTVQVECDVSVPGNCPDGVPAGSVVFFLDADNNGVFEEGEPSYRVQVDGSGRAQMPVPLEIGTYNIKANYLGDIEYNGSTTTFVDVTVTPAPTMVALSVQPTDPVTIDSVSVTVTVSPTAGSIPGYAPTGSVELTVDEGTPQSITLGAGGVGVSAAVEGLTVSPPPHTIHAHYLGDGNFLESTKTEDFVVAPARTEVTLLNFPPPAVYGEPVMIKAEVTAFDSNNSGEPVVDGSVQFTIGSTSGSRPLVNGVATFEIELPVGDGYEVSAVYTPGSDPAAYEGSELPPGSTFSVAPAGVTSIEFSYSPSNPVYGPDNVAMTATVVTSPSIPDAAAEGRVEFTIPGSEPFSVNLEELESWTASPTVTMFGGLNEVSVRYFDASNVADFGPVSVEVIVDPAPTTITLTPSPTAPIAGQPVIFTATVETFDGATPEGTVTFTIDNLDPGEVDQTIGPIDLAAMSPPSWTVVTDALTLDAGQYEVSAHYEGTNNYLSSDTASSTTLQVRYLFTGFLSPLPMVTADMIGETSRNLGSAVPLKWELRDGAGNVISDTDSLAMITAVWESGPVPPQPENSTLKLYSPGNGAKGSSYFRFTDPGFAFNWDTGSGAEVLGFYLVEVKLDDGVSYRLRVELK